jgi:hypothetical protein
MYLKKGYPKELKIQRFDDNKIGTTSENGERSYSRALLSIGTTIQ